MPVYFHTKILFMICMHLKSQGMDFHREKLKLPQSGQTQPIKLQFLKTCRNSQENDWFKKIALLHSV